MNRNELPEAHRWNLEDIYANDEAVERDFAALDGAQKELAALKGTLAGGSAALLEVLRRYFDSHLMMDKLYAYAMMRKDEDNRVAESQALFDRAQGMYVRLDEAGSYLMPELLALPKGTIDGYIAQNDAFAPYKRFLSEAERLRDHTLDEAGERLLAMAGEVMAAPSSIFRMIANADMKFDPVKNEKGDEVELTHGSYSAMLENPERSVRKAAFESMFSAHKKQENTIGSTYASSVKADVFLSRARNFSSSLAAALEPDEVPGAVYDNLIQVIEDSAPAMGRYLELRKRKLGLDQICFYDLYVPIARGWDLKVPYEQAAEIVKKGLTPLGAQYGKDLERAFAQRWIDVDETPGKTSGAYSCGVHQVHPYVLLNYMETLDNIFTIAHEMGHAMHSYYSSQTQEYPLSEYVIFVAEVASTVNELLLLDHLIRATQDKSAKAALLNHKLESIRGTVYRQTLFAAFERESHRIAESGEPLTNQAMSAAYQSLYERYYPGLEIGELLPLEWMRIPHFYRAFYVYQYATGFSAAAALSRAILDGKEGALDRYLTFLSSGGSKSPLDLLADAGVDLRSPDPVKACMKEFSDTLDELEKLL